MRFCSYVAEVEEHKRNQIKTKHFQIVNWLVKQQFRSVSNSENNICNLFSIVLSQSEKFVLARGLDFCLPPTNVKRESNKTSKANPLFLNRTAVLFQGRQYFQNRKNFALPVKMFILMFL